MKTGVLKDFNRIPISMAGAQGPQGEQGVAGQGFIIAQVFNSVAELLVGSVPDGQFGLVAGTLPESDPNYGSLYLYSGGSWSYKTDMSVQGITGPQGTVGAQGEAGAQGNAGVQGFVGVQGEIGAQGDQGAQGDVGIQGVQGAQGDVGPQGVQGPSGSSYVQSFTSADGYVFTVTHNLNSTYNSVSVYDNDGYLIIPDQIIVINNNSLTLDLTSAGVITGTWRVVVLSGGTVASGGSQNIFSDGSTISGTFDSDVFGQGNLIVDGELNINGDLILNGSLINHFGYNVNILGDLISNDLNFTPDNPSITQGNLSVKGDLKTNSINYEMTPTSTSTLSVGGDLHVNVVTANGLSDSNGLIINVLGNVVCTDYIEINGGDAIVNNTAGSGGNLIVHGNASIGTVYAMGGWCDDSIAVTGNKSAGNGGMIYVYQNLTCINIQLNGGTGSESSAGNGGSCYVLGDSQIYYYLANGGNCQSNTLDHRSGSGGQLNATNIFCYYVYMHGGSRWGTCSGLGNSAPPNGGTLIAQSARISDIDLVGGTISINDGSPSASAGHGGNITVQHLDALHIYLSGGANNYNDGGNGGHIELSESLSAITIQANGGFSQGILQTGVSGGLGGTILANGYGGSFIITCNSVIEMNGGSSSGGNGNTGGSISTDPSGNCILQLPNCNVSLVGGSCLSTNSSFRAGNGGTINCNSINGFPEINVSAGIIDRGNSFVNLGNTSANAGNIIVAENASVESILGIGGDVNTSFYSTLPNAGGGNGAVITIGQDLHITTLNARGGNCLGSFGGNGGTVTVGGNLNFKTINLYGGFSTANVVDTTVSYAHAGNGGSLIVQGNLINDIGYDVWSYSLEPSINLCGGGGYRSSGGSGGLITVNGNVNVGGSIVSFGGFSIKYESPFTTLSAGNGGTCNITGNLNIWGSIILDGGRGDYVSAGVGGTLNVGGNTKATDLTSAGGDCDNLVTEFEHSGTGGNINLLGNVVCNNIIVSGGNVANYDSNEISSFGDQSAPHSGNIFINGCCTVNSLYAQGGSIFTSPSAPSHAGWGGNITINNVTSAININASGGSSNGSNGGSAKRISIKNQISADFISISGGTSYNGNGGNGGEIKDVSEDSFIDSNLSCNIIARFIELYGGESHSGNAGYGGYIGIRVGDLICEYINVDGGTCYSTNPDHFPAPGGGIRACSIYSYISGNGGNRIGNTTAISSYVGNADGGSVATSGSLHGSISLNGGYNTPSNTATTHYPTLIGGNGGYISISGVLNSYSISINGGYAYGKDGGNAGQLSAGYIDCHTISAIGGASNAITTPAAPAGIKGSGGGISVRSGISCYSLTSKDGSSGSATTNPMEIYLAGSCHFKILDVTSRTDSKIYGLNSYSNYGPAILKVLSMPGKNTLDINSSTASGSIAAYLSDSIFSCSSSSWYRHTGTSI